VPKTWIYHPELKQRLWLSVEDNIWPKKFRLFAEKILGLDGTISIRRAAKEADVHRKTAGKYLKIMEQTNLLMSGMGGVPPKKVYSSQDSPLLREHDLQEFYDKLKVITDRYFNRDHPAIGTKMRAFSDWGPDSQKLIENLENALWRLG